MKHYLIFGIIGLLSCNQPIDKTAQTNNQTPISPKSEFHPVVTYQYQGLTINKKRIDISGRIIVAEKYVDIVNDKQTERYSITKVQTKNSQVIVESKNNRNEIAKWEFHKGRKRVEISATINNSNAIFDVINGNYESLPFFSMSSDTDELYDWNKKYQGQRIKYTINVPESFKQQQANRKNIDTKFVDDYGSSILVNVSPRQTEEYGITTHDYNKKMFEDMFKQVTPNAKITYEERCFVDNIESYIFEEVGASANLKSIHCYFYLNDKAIVITATAEEKRFDDYRNLFRNAIFSFKKP